MWIEAWLSVPFINHIYLVDGGSTDRSVEIAKSYKRVSVNVVPWKNDFAKQRNIALKFAKANWVMQPDIDEIPCNTWNSFDFEPSPEVNSIPLPYIKFFDWNTLWFFTDGNTPSFADNTVTFGFKETITIFKKSNLIGYVKSLHEQLQFRSNVVQWDLKSKTASVDELDNMMFVGHYDQAKHFEQARRNKTSLELEMGLKRARYRLISAAEYEGKIYDAKWAEKALAEYSKENFLMIEDLGAKQLESFRKQHALLGGHLASRLNHAAINKHLTLINTSGMNYHKLSKISKLLKEIKERGTNGAILEFGVWEGCSLSEMVKKVRLNNMNNRLFGFDSFEGLPRSESTYKDGVAQKDEWKKGDYCSSYENTVHKMTAELGNLDEVTLVKGIYENVLDDDLRVKLGLEYADLIHIDCDLVSSTDTVLNFCKPLMRPGTFLVFDEWACGENHSWDKFEKLHNIKVEHGQGMHDNTIGNHIVKILEI